MLNWAMHYELAITPRARRQMRKLPDAVQKRIRQQLNALCLSPRKSSLDIKKLSGRSGYRLRVGDYRVIYELEDAQLIVMVLEMGHRREVYQ